MRKYDHRDLVASCFYHPLGVSTVLSNGACVHLLVITLSLNHSLTHSLPPPSCQLSTIDFSADQTVGAVVAESAPKRIDWRRKVWAALPSRYSPTHTSTQGLVH